jgi:hypothetical protein
VTRNELIDLFSIITLFDRRIVPDNPERQAAQVDAWYAIVGDLPFGDARTAVRDHYRDRSDWIMPADIRKRVKAMQADRIARSQIPAPPAELTDDPVAYNRHLAASIDQAASGRAAIEGGAA